MRRDLEKSAHNHNDRSSSNDVQVYVCVNRCRARNPRTPNCPTERCLYRHCALRDAPRRLVRVGVLGPEAGLRRPRRERHQQGWVSAGLNAGLKCLPPHPLRKRAQASKHSFPIAPRDLAGPIGILQHALSRAGSMSRNASRDFYGLARSTRTLTRGLSINSTRRLFHCRLPPASFYRRAPRGRSQCPL